MTTIDTLQQLINALPLNSRLAGPCPFCEGDGKHSVYEGFDFYGEDRFFLFPDNKAWGCRVCRQKGRGPTKTGWFSHSNLAEKLNLSLSSSFISTYSFFTDSARTDPLQFLTYNQVLQNHQNVVREYWHQFGWKDATINRFILGFGKIETWRTSGHLIPMDVTNTIDSQKIPGFYTALRAAGHKIKQRGSSKNYMWHIQDDPYLTTCVVVEGEKDLITAWQMGHKNIICTFSSYWNPNFSNFVAGTYADVIIYHDWDPAGEAWLASVIESLSTMGVTISYLSWAKVKNAIEGDDLTDHYARMIKSNILMDEYADTFIAPVLVKKKANAVRQKPTVNARLIPLDDIRGEGADSMVYEVNSFLTNYIYKRGAGKMLLLGVGPGAGKTYTLYRTAERQAKFWKGKRQKEYDRLLGEVEELDTELLMATDEEKVELLPFIDKQRSLLNKYSFNVIAWYAPYKNGIAELFSIGADPELWYDFQARSEVNCKAFDITSVLGRENHAVGQFCELSCPFSEQCRKNGYLFQKEEMRAYPIVFYRHEHLQDSPSTSIQTTFIDESVTKIVDTPLIFNSADLSPFSPGWELDVEDDIYAEILNFFVEAIRSACSFNAGEPQNILNKTAMNPKYILWGNSIFKLLDKYYSSNGRELAEIMAINNGCSNAYQPTFLSGDPTKIKKRCLSHLITALKRELPLYLCDKDKVRPSTIFIVSGTFEVYLPPRIRLPARIPLIIADATPMLELYQAIFKREMRVYSPVFRSPDTEIIIVSGSDWSRGYIESQLGKYMAIQEKVQAEVGELTESVKNIDNVPSILDGYFKSSVFSDIIYILEHLKKIHSSVLVVTHKNLREFMESIITGCYSKRDEENISQVSWGHYGALRGTNKYEGYEALCLIGAFRIPYDVLWRKAQVWAYGLGLEDSIPQTLVHSGQDYSLLNGGVFGNYITFQHWLADKLVNFIERGEMIQCAHRIRPHSSKTKKTVYIFATRPITDFATKLIEKHKFLRSIRKTVYGNLFRYLKKEFLDTGKFPTYMDTKLIFKVSNTTISEVRREIQNVG